MRDVLRTRLVVLGRIEQRYCVADREWRRAADAARAFFPAGHRPPRSTIGDPNSRVRILWERRERALLALMAAQRRMKAAERRLAATVPRRPILPLPASPR